MRFEQQRSKANLVLETLKRVQHSSNFKERNGKMMEMGKMQGVKIKLHIDPSVNPVALPHCRIPFNFRDKVENEIERLVNTETLSKVYKKLV